MEEKKLAIYSILIVSCLCVGVFIGLIIAANGLAFFYEKYSVVKCITELDNSLNIESNKLPFTKESQYEAIQWRCAKEYINFNITDYDELFVMK